MRENINIKKIWISAAIITIIFLSYLSIKFDCESILREIEFMKADRVHIGDKINRLKKVTIQLSSEEIIVERAINELGLQKAIIEPIIIEIK